jgi:hypothetical protein
VTTLYDTICSLWPQYRSLGRSALERLFVQKYPPTCASYRPLLALPRDGRDPLQLLSPVD